MSDVLEVSIGTARRMTGLGGLGEDVCGIVLKDTPVMSELKTE